VLSPKIVDFELDLDIEIEQFVETRAIQVSGSDPPEQVVVIVRMKARALKTVRTRLGWSVQANATPAPCRFEQIEFVPALPALDHVSFPNFQCRNHDFLPVAKAVVTALTVRNPRATTINYLSFLLKGQEKLRKKEKIHRILFPGLSRRKGARESVRSFVRANGFRNK
jgi:hypothetical protein